MDPEFAVPASLDEAVRCLEHEGAVAVGGGTQVGLLLRQGLIDPSRLVWLERVAGLREIRSDVDGSLLIGSGATLSEIAGSPVVRSAHPMVARAAAHVGNPRVRAVGTLGGHLVHADPRQDLPPCLLVLAAEVRLLGRKGTRDVPLRDFYRGPFETAVQDGELLIRVKIPASPEPTRCCYLRFTPGTSNDYPTVGVAALAEFDAGATRRAAVGLGGVAPRPLLVDLPQLAGRPLDATALAAAGQAAATACDPASDQRGSAGYKRAMVRLWTERALRACRPLDG
ncbi:MAG TPA: FAD binding domain-containing protein [Candidatus Dormibacteraeota bacterium]|nr:FAD binding domain-containing protein [Candidatus Dormibacteraeota bacterium]